jgi:hypothetical protein
VLSIFEKIEVDFNLFMPSVKLSASDNHPLHSGDGYPGGLNLDGRLKKGRCLLRPIGRIYSRCQNEIKPYGGFHSRRNEIVYALIARRAARNGYWAGLHRFQAVPQNGRSKIL